MKNKPKQKKITCTACQRTLAMGEDVLVLEEGVLGPRGIVPLGDTRYYCNEQCLNDSGDSEDYVTMPPRFP